MDAIDEERQSAVLEMAVQGDWADVRTSWDGIRRRMLDLEEAPQTKPPSDGDSDDDGEEDGDGEEQESLL